MSGFEYDPEKIEKHREFIGRMQQNDRRSIPKSVNVTTFFVRLKGRKLMANVYRPTTIEASFYPTVIHIRGTGYIASARYFSHIICGELAEKSNCQIIEIDHRFAPEFPYPNGFNDIYETYLTIIKNAKLLKIDINRLAISGYSSGGNFATLTAIKAIKNNFSFLSFQLLVSPIIDSSRSLTKFKHEEEQDSFPEPLAQWFIDLHVQDHDPKDPSLSPYWAKDEDLRGLTPVYFIYGGHDRFRGDSEIFADRLSELGVDVYKTIFKSASHIFLWYEIRVLETMAKQIRERFNLIRIERPISCFFAPNNSFRLNKVACNEENIVEAFSKINGFV